MNRIFLGIVLLLIITFSAYSCSDFYEKCRQAGGTMVSTRDLICVDAEGRIINGKLRNG